MKNKIPTGSYVIRNKKTSTVLHVEDPNPKSPDSAKKRGIVASAQDENRYREQQVWWIEPFPDCNEDDQDGLVYSIMNTSNGKFLDLNPGRGGDGIRKGRWELWHDTGGTDIFRPHERWTAACHSARPCSSVAKMENTESTG